MRYRDTVTGQGKLFRRGTGVSRVAGSGSEKGWPSLEVPRKGWDAVSQVRVVGLVYKGLSARLGVWDSRPLCGFLST